uniref:Uncharacterized protein n=1 Tax=Rhizophora mucronata TaxID=61149 RepID=A0A2P2N566_RHIMU
MKQEINLVASSGLPCLKTHFKPHAHKATLSLSSRTDLKR